MSDSRTDLTTFSRLFCVTNSSPNLLKLLQNSNELSLLFQTRTTTKRTPRSEEGEVQARRNRNMCRSTALAHNLSTHSVWLFILFLYALPRRQSPYPSLRGATVLKCVTIDYYAAIREVVYNLHTIRSNKDGLFKASPKKVGFIGCSFLCGAYLFLGATRGVNTTRVEPCYFQTFS